mgnify:FL=1
MKKASNAMMLKGREIFTLTKQRDALLKALHKILAVDSAEDRAMDKHDNATPGERDSWDAYMEDVNKFAIKKVDAIDDARKVMREVKKSMK